MTSSDPSRERPAPLPPPQVERVVGRTTSGLPGPALVAVAGIHGNEPAGIYAARRVLAAIEERRPVIRGEFVVLAGNRAALAQGVRYQAKDLNRVWTPERVAALDAAEPASSHDPASHDPEDAEQRELYAALRDVRDRAAGEVTLIDMHSTSADGAPFLAIVDDPAPRAFAAHFPLTVLRGLVDRLAGTMIAQLAGPRLVTMVLESGQNQRLSSVDHGEAVLWIGLVAAGVLDERDAPDLAPMRELLRRARGDLPRDIAVTYRHAIADDDEFRMLPGFAHFQPVHAGQLLAHDVRGEVRSPQDGFILLPLYQGLGDDGFFLGTSGDSGD